MNHPLDGCDEAVARIEEETMFLTYVRRSGNVQRTEVNLIPEVSRALGALRG
jgi:hypothetical protein